MLYCSVLYCIALHCIALHCIALHCIASPRLALPCIALHCIALHCIVLYCIVLYYCLLLLQDVHLTFRSGTNSRLAPPANDTGTLMETLLLRRRSSLTFFPLRSNSTRSMSGRVTSERLVTWSNTSRTNTYSPAAVRRQCEAAHSGIVQT